MDKKYLVLKGCAGLGNRLFTVCAAATYANRNRRKLYIDWSDGQFGSKGKNIFYQFFELEDVDYITSIADIPSLSDLSVYPKSWRHNLEKGVYETFTFHNNEAFPGSLRKVLRSANIKGSLAKCFGFWQLKIQNFKGLYGALLSVLKSDCFPTGSYYRDNLNEDIVVFVDFAPATSAATLKKYIRLKPPILADVKAFVDRYNLNKNAIGVHVRATDKKPTTGFEAIFSKIKNLELQNPVIFLATDNVQVAQSFYKEFPQTITFASDLPEIPEGMGVHQLGFRSENGELAAKVFQQSLMDMWLLSECEYLFFQGNSTFSIISSFLHSDQTKVFDWQAN